jgi:hypothetical protein
MNYIRHLTAVFEKTDADQRLTPFHISLYMALFRIWNINYFRNPIIIARDEIMQMSKIGSVNTYTKSLKELNQWGYIKYEPSFNPHKGSQIYLYSFDKGADRSSEMALRPLINNTNTKNETNLGKQAQNFNDNNFMEIKEKEKLRQKKKPENQEIEQVRESIPPLESHVKIYFEEKNYPAIEAEKFFNYFQSNGWLVGGKTKMKDWKAAARNWILNMEKFQKPKPIEQKSNRLSSTDKKNYGEPL